MTRRMFSTAQWIGAAALCASGCATGPYAQNNTAAGALLGTATGAVIGATHGSSAEGALIGAVAGAVGGNLIGDAQDARVERDMAIAHAQHVQATSNPPLTNDDLIRMSQTGLSDAVIIGSIHNRGGMFDTSPNGLIFLKSNGVSDGVIQVAQSSLPASAPPAALIAPPPAGVVVIEPPRPQFGLVISGGSHRRHRHHHHW